MRFGQTGWVVLAFLVSSGATLYYLLDWPRASFQDCWNNYAQIPLEDGSLHQWSDFKGCRETSASEAIKGNVRGAELAIFLHSATEDKKTAAFFMRKAVALGSERSKSILVHFLREDGLKNCPEILALIQSYRPSGKYPEGERYDGYFLADTRKECEGYLAAKVK